MLMAMLQRYLSSLMDKSRAISGFLERRMARVCAAWLAIVTCLALFRLARPAGPIHNLADAWPILAAYTLIAIAPILGYVVGRGAFAGRYERQQPAFRLARLGRWRNLDYPGARARPDFGTVGFMASLLVGILLNVVVRTIEFFAAIPAVSWHAPVWSHTLFAMMAADVVVTCFFYMAAFAMALRTVPMFPRMLLYCWMVDAMMQVLIAHQIAQVAHVPAEILPPLQALLQGNIVKVAISAVVWLPYLLLSERVNVTYRHRTAAT